MYEAHYGLARKPFGESVDPACYVPLASRESALRRLRYGLEHAQGPVMITGVPGAGKSLLARTLATDLDLEAIHLAFPSLSARDVLDYLAQELGVEPEGTPSAASLLRAITSHLRATTETGNRPLLIIDEAHLMTDTDLFETCRSLLNFASTGAPDLSLLMVGNTELQAQMPPGFADRIVARCLLGPLTEPESADYILGRLKAAGTHRPIFPPEALAALHAASAGLPRRLNLLADLCLLITYARNDPQPDVDTVLLAAEEAGFELLAA